MRNPIDIETIGPFGKDKPPPNVLTVDVEDWYHVNYKSMDRSSIDTSVSRVYENTMSILEILDRSGSKATFFLLGCVARKHPELVRAIDRGGHETACHGNTHELVYEQTPSEFKKNLKEAAESVSMLTGKKVIGFRAPSWSITEKNLWAFDIIREEGFLYDSSVFPIKNYLYGIMDFPARPCWIKTTGDGKLLELPPPAFEFCKVKIPCGGGIYTRFLPFAIQKRIIATMNSRGQPFMMYLHPGDIDTKHFKIDLSVKERLLHDLGRRSARKKFLMLLQNYRWSTILETFSEYLFDRQI